jgi:hypothetical protein
MSTIVDNKTVLRIYSISDPDDISPAGHGGGLYVLSANLFSVVGSIISDNFREIPGGLSGSDCAKMPGDGLQSLGYNVIRYPVTDFTVADIEYQCNVFVDPTGKFGPDVIGQDPMLEASDPIQYFTPAYVPNNPGTDSPAVDLVPMQKSGTPLCGILDSQLGTYVDQLGNHRPLGSKCDAGSIEIGGSGSDNTLFLPAIRRQ